ncbi:MAG: PQQ-binding-like beta-propeller repeat protein [Mariprofundaceae bacterium]
MIRSPLLIAVVFALTACSTHFSEKKVDSNQPLEVLWSVNVDQRQPMSPYGYARPAVAGERIVMGARDSRAHIYDLKGSELGRIALDAPSESGALLLTNGDVVLGDNKGNIYAIDPVASVVRWQKTLASILMGTPVAIEQGFIIQGADNHMYAFSEDGEKLWSYAGEIGGLSMHLGTSPLVSHGRVYAAFNNGEVVALDAANGDLLWRRHLIIDTRAAVLSELQVPVADPVLVDGMLVIAFYQGDMMALDPINGENRWQRQISTKSTPLSLQNSLFVATSEGALMALDASSGESLWKQQLIENDLVGPVLMDQMLVVADSEGYVYQFDMQGNKLAMLPLDGSIDHAPLVMGVHGMLIRNNLGTLYAVR